MLKQRYSWLKYLVALVVIFAGCVTGARVGLDRLYGQSDTHNRQQVPATVAHPQDASSLYHTQIKPIIESRCVVCHACYDAPCQLKMTSAEGIERGANKTPVYQGSRLVAAKPNRLFLDATTLSQWRERDFFPVLNERQQTPQANTQASVLAQMLLLKKQHPLTGSKLLSEDFDVSLGRTNQCPTIEQFSDYASSRPLAGMPYGLPALQEQHQQILLSWLQDGARMAPPAQLSEEQLNEVATFESFLNQDDLKTQLSARYIYEHLFTSHLFFSELVQNDNQAQFYRLVRSKSQPGQPIQVIATRRPFDPPETERVYYRLQPVHETIVNKTHQPYAIHPELMAKWQAWFIDAHYSITALPGYAPELAANPLTAFAQLPVNARYRFMLERAENTIMGYIKGPVCRGQVALNVINDRFWVYFLKPELANSAKVEAFYQSQQDNLRLPAQQQSTASAIDWPAFAARQGKYLSARNRFLNKTVKSSEYLQVSALWDGDGENTNASLTVFRHFDNATVVKGLIGEPPKTAWVIDYALLERIHYLLVAGFDVYGNYGHQLMTRLYMDFLRLEGEANFIALLPADVRDAEFDSWYQKAGPELITFFKGNVQPFKLPTAVKYQSKQYKAELFAQTKAYLQDVQPKELRVADAHLQQESIQLLSKLDDKKGKFAAILPEITMIMIEPQDSNQAEIFTLLRNSAHFNVNSLFDEEDNRDYDNDDLTLVHGLVGSYPDAFWQLKESQLADLVTRLSQLQTQQDYTQLLDTYGVRRSAEDFWTFSDKLNRAFMQHQPISGGWLDYNRLENR